MTEAKGQGMYDLIIIGGGPAGLTAAIYALRARVKTLVLEKEIVGGQIALSDVIENYPGFPSISGQELMEKFEAHAKGFGMEIKFAAVENIGLDGNIKVLKTSEGELQAKAVIVATGAKPRMLGVPGEKEFFGKGVSYCATCDGPFFKGQTIAVVGGGDTAEPYPEGDQGGQDGGQRSCARGPQDQGEKDIGGSRGLHVRGDKPYYRFRGR
jgi:thioredoxin reductase (NADPH)